MDGDRGAFFICWSRLPTVMSPQTFAKKSFVFHLFNWRTKDIEQPCILAFFRHAQCLMPQNGLLCSFRRLRHSLPDTVTFFKTEGKLELSQPISCLLMLIDYTTVLSCDSFKQIVYCRTTYTADRGATQTFQECLKRPRPRASLPLKR